MKRETSVKGLVLYEQVLQKNFEIIQTFLNKFPVIFKKQDNFEESLKKINEKLFSLDTQNDKYREQMNMSVSILDKKISHLKENVSRTNRNSTKFSQEMVPLEQRKNSIFRIGSPKEQKEPSPVISKEKLQLLSEIDKRQQQNIKKMTELEEDIAQMQEKINFMSVINGKTEQSVDRILEQKVDKSNFQKLSHEFQKKFQKHINELANKKYEEGQTLIDQQFTFLEKTFKEQIDRDLTKLKSQLLAQLQKKAAVAEIKQQLKQIKKVIERMVDESVESFASKQQTKKALQLFEKKFTKLELVIEQLLQYSLKITGPQPSQDLSLGVRKQKDGLMSGFGRKRRVNQKNA